MLFWMCLEYWGSVSEVYDNCCYTFSWSVLEKPNIVPSLPFQEEDGEIYVSIQQLRDRSDELRHEIEALEQQRDSDSLLRKRQELRLTENRLLEKTEERTKSR